MIRPEKPSDCAAIGAAATVAFSGADHSSGNEAAIVEMLRRAGALAISLVAEEEGKLVGHVAFSPVRIVGCDGDWYGLGPVSVLPERQRSGVGTALIRDGLSRLKSAGAAGCVVVGDPQYYRRFGFVSDPALRYGDLPAEYLQRVVFSGASPVGQVEYHPGFDAS